MVRAPVRRRAIAAGPFLARRIEDRHVRDIAVGLFGEEYFLVLVGEEDAAIEEGVQPLVVSLVVIGNQRMIVALGALQIHAEEDAP